MSEQLKILSVIIPAYNEEQYIGKLLDIIHKIPTESLGYQKEIIVVDDCSKDRTNAVIQEYQQKIPGITLIKQPKNMGKGAAVQAGIKAATGRWFLVQDADLEYDPQDYLPMLEELKAESNTAIYGSRVLKIQQDSMLGKHPDQKWGPWLAGRILSIWTWLLYGKWISDTLTAYKLYPSHIVKNFDVVTKGFETDHELTAKLIKAGVAIREVPIAYIPRSVEEGKKIKMRDFFIALYTLIRFRTAA